MNNGENEKTWTQWVKEQWYWVLPLMLVLMGLVVSAMIYFSSGSSVAMPVVTNTQPTLTPIPVPTSVPVAPAPVALPTMISDASFDAYMNQTPNAQVWLDNNLRVMQLPQGQIVATPILPPQR